VANTRERRTDMPQPFPGRDVPPSALAQEVQALQVAELFRNLPAGAASALAGTFLCVAVLAQEGMRSAHVAWLAYGIVVAAVRLGMCWAYRAGAFGLDPAGWARLAVFGNFLAGVQWALLGTWLFPAEAGPRQNFAIMVITCFVGGSITAYAPVRWAHPALSVPATVPASIHIFFIESGPHPLSGVMAFFFVGMVLFYAFRESEMVAQRLRADVRLRRQLNELQSTVRHAHGFPPPMMAPSRRS
jgi:hypothetical protein